MFIAGLLSCAGELPPLAAVELGQWQLATAHCILFEKECHTGGNALIANIAHPIPLHGPRPTPPIALCADDRPIDPLEVEGAEIFEQRLERDKTHWGRGRAQHVEPMQRAPLSDTGAEPQVDHPLPGEEIARPLGPLG
jgi:hypothetical protein